MATTTARELSPVPVVTGPADHSGDQDILDFVSEQHLGEAASLLVQRYGDVVRNYCRRQLRDQSQVDDVQQQVFIEALRDLPRFARRSSLRTWLLGIAHHRMLDATRRTQRGRETRTEDSVLEELHRMPDPAPSPAECFEDEQLHRTLRACLRDLGEGTQMTVFLRYHLDCSFEEIAQICGGSAGAHHARVSRALRQLRVRMADQVDDACTAAQRQLAERMRKAG